MQLSKRILLQQPLLIATVLLLGLGSLCLGQYPLSLSEVFYHLMHYSDAEGIAGQVIWTVRLPRILMALLAGGALGLCGATLQGIVTEENLFLAYGLPLRKLSVENHPTPFIAPLFTIRR